MSLETFFTPYHAIDSLPGKTVAVLAPHADDEVFGCGGTLAALVERGADVKVLVISDGENHGDSDVSSSERSLESIRAAEILGYSAPMFWTLRDSKLSDEKTLLDQVKKWLFEIQADLLIAPSLWEMHRDHRAVAIVALRAMEVLPTHAKLAMYEVGVPLTPNALIDITAHASKKMSAMECFNSQLAMQSYAQQIDGLNTFRTYTLAKTVERAEAFKLLSRDEALAFDYSLAPEQHVEVLRHAENQILQALQNNQAALHLTTLLEQSERHHHALDKERRRTGQQLYDAQNQLLLIQQEHHGQKTEQIHQLKQYEQEIQQQKQQIQQYEQQIEGARYRSLLDEQQYRDNQRKLHLARQQLHEVTADLQLVVSSTSWKITAPLRRLKKKWISKTS